MGRFFNVYASRIRGETSRRVAIVFNDITDLRDAQKSVRESEARFRDPAGHEILGMRRDEGLACSVEDAGAPEEHHRVPGAIASFADGRVHRTEWRFRRKDGSNFFGEMGARQLAGGLLQGVLRDTTERTWAQDTQQLLLGELNHRIKNTLATVQSIAQMTMKHTKDPVQFAQTFTERVRSPSRVHAILTDASWEGADLRAVIQDQLLAGVGQERQITITGPDVRLPAQLALHIALIVHELGTNAVKYEALSKPGGSVIIGCTVAGATLQLRWRERGGPRAVAPSRRRFGSTLIESTATGDGGRPRRLLQLKMWFGISTSRFRTIRCRCVQFRTSSGGHRALLRFRPPIHPRHCPGYEF